MDDPKSADVLLRIMAYLAGKFFRPTPIDVSLRGVTGAAVNIDDKQEGSGRGQDSHVRVADTLAGDSHSLNATVTIKAENSWLG
jgi:hypothetical protein